MTETIPYTVLKKIGILEIRHYPEVLFAVVENDEYDSGFNLLFQYITGGKHITKEDTDDRSSRYP
jgi:SOUL heme-binding protein